MKTTCFFLSLLLVLAQAGCAEKSSLNPPASQPATPQRPYFKLTPSAKRLLVEKALTLKQGDPYQSATNALGKPTFDQSLNRKEDGRNIGRSLSYCAVIWESGLVNELEDELISVCLDENGRVSAVLIKVTLE